MGAATVTLSPSFRKPAPATTTRTPASSPSTEVWSSLRDSTVTGTKRTEESAFSTKTPDLLLRYRTASVGTTVAGRAPASIAARANMPGFSALPGERLMRARPRRVCGSTSGVTMRTVPVVDPAWLEVMAAL